MKDTFSNRLNLAMEIRHKTASDISKKTGISRSRMSRYMHGEYGAKQRTIDELSEVLNVSQAWLMGYDVPMERVSSPTIANNGNMTIGDNYMGNEIHANTPLKMDYTEDEKELVKMYRKLSIINRAKVITYIAELGENNGQK